MTVTTNLMTADELLRMPDDGEVVSSDTGFLLATNPDTVRCPDVAFIRAGRVPANLDTYLTPPDLAVEVVSPSDKLRDVLEKKDDYLRAGVKAVVIVDPPTRSVTIHRTTGATGVQDVLSVDDVVPGWQLPLWEIFES
jgi:Uma2 family endonuclease